MVLLNSRVQVPSPENEPVLSYAPLTPERQALKDELVRLGSERIEIPWVIGGERVRSTKTAPARVPHEHARVLATVHQGGPAEVARAIAKAEAAWKDWSRWPWEARAAIFLKAADLLSGQCRQTLNAATMLGQSKTAHQAEIDAVCELCDFWRFNVAYAAELYAEQPHSPAGVWNQSELRPLEGFVLAVTPFNFTSIAGNLPTAPAIMGNTVVWKPASTAAYAAWFIMQVLEQAGLPPGVVNLVFASGSTIGDAALGHPGLAGVHFTGSTAVFQGMWRRIGERIATYRSYPRLVGETGGKDFIVAHPSADPEAVVTAIVRGGYEYQGQKCSAASRVYVAQSLWDKIEDPLVQTINGLRVGDVADFTNFMGAVIDAASFDKLEQAIGAARKDPNARILAGGECDRSVGWFIRPTLIQVKDPKHDLMSEELFGPVVAVFVFPDRDFERILELCDQTSPYALTGSIMATERHAIHRAHEVLRHAAGNFYVNDKPTGAVVGQQPFGGARASGTNDKAGSPLNLLRWVSARTIKETFCPPTGYRYPFMREP